jgi:fructuronate reductase
LRDLARDPRVRFAAINAPENAYGMVYNGGDFAEPTSETVKGDMVDGTFNSDAAKWTAFALERYRAGLNFAIASCTNYSKNGFMTGAVVRTIGKMWEEKGFAPKGFTSYLSDPSRFAFPNSMVDRIAVAPDAKTFQILEELGIDSSVIATERTRYWALEDAFPNGRPPLEAAEGVFMCENFSEVKKYEDMKLRILNMSHSAIAGLGVLLGYRGNYAIYRAMQDKDLTRVIEEIIDIVIEVVDPPKNLSPKQFALDTITRLNNPNIPDDPMRIAFNGSTKMVPRFLDTYFEAREKGISADRLKVILLPVAGFLRYTMGIDDAGESFALESDPIKETLTACGAGAKIGDPLSAAAFRPLISDAKVMGKDLYAYEGVGSQLEKIVSSMLEGPDAVRKALHGR